MRNAPSAEPGGPPPSPPARRARTLRDYGLRALSVLFVLNAVDELDRAVLAVSLDRIADDFGLSDATVGLLPLAVIFITGLLSLPAGNLADRLTRTKILAVGSIVWGGAGLLAAGAQSFTQLFLTRALLGVGQGTINPTHASLLSDYYPIAVRGRALSYHRSANALGQVIGAIIGGAIVAWAGWRWGFVSAAVPGLIFGMYALSLREPARGESDLQSALEEDPLLADFLREPAGKLSFFASLGHIMRIRTLRYLIATNAAFGFTLFGVIYWFPTFFERAYGLDTRQASALFGGLALAGFLGTWFGGPYADRNVQRGFTRVTRVLAVAAAVLLVTWTIGLAIPLPAASFALIAGGGFLAAFGSAGAPAIVAACAPPRIRSQAFAAFGLALAVCGAAAAPLVVGVLSELFQQRWGMSEAAGLRVAMILAVCTAMTLGTWLVWQASRSAAEDVRRTMAAFLAERTRAPE